MTVTCVSHDRHMYITQLSRVYHMTVTCVSHDRHMCITRLSQVCHTTVTCVSHDCHMYHMTVTCVSHDLMTAEAVMTFAVSGGQLGDNWFHLAPAPIPHGPLIMTFSAWVHYQRLWAATYIPTNDIHLFPSCGATTILSSTNINYSCILIKFIALDSWCSVWVPPFVFCPVSWFVNTHTTNSAPNMQHEPHAYIQVAMLKEVPCSGPMGG